MNTLTVKLKVPKEYGLTVTDDTLTVELDYGHTASVPLAWYPQLQYASTAERNNWGSQI